MGAWLNRTWITVAIVGAIFTLAHIDAWTGPGLVYVAGFSAAFGIGGVRAGSVAPLCGLHAAHNAMEFLWFRESNAVTTWPMAGFTIMALSLWLGWLFWITRTRTAGAVPSAFAVGRLIGSRFPRFLGWGTLVLGLASLSFGELRRHYQLQSLQWPMTKGIIMQADLAEGTSSYGRMRGPRTFYYADVTYTYHVADNRYVAKRISLVNPHLATEDGEKARSFLAAHPAHSSVDVYYHRRHPEIAILIPEVDEAQWLRWCGVGLTLVAIWTLISSRKVCARLKAQSEKP